ncbi:MAG: hypothetical protein QE271_04945 [Bacteriovoracaceae bacterium]|nr:hypothetical protein [Bacteriovoracaceae bacterium]
MKSFFLAITLFTTFTVLAGEVITFSGDAAEKTYNELKTIYEKGKSKVSFDTDAEAKYLKAPNIECENNFTETFKGYYCRFVFDTKGRMSAPK